MTKSLSVLLWLLPVLTATLISCDRQSLSPAPVIEPPLIQIHYDGENVTAPLLPAGVYEAGIKLTPLELIGLNGRRLREVILFVESIPVAATVRIYEGSSNGGPDVLRSSHAVRSDLEPNSWNRILLPTAVDIDVEQDVWIAFRFETGSPSQTLGCDAGPASEHGEYLYERADNLWQKLSARTAGGININWNLRAVIE